MSVEKPFSSAMDELSVYFEGHRHIMTGVSESTTADDLIYAILWYYQRPLDPSSLAMYDTFLTIEGKLLRLSRYSDVRYLCPRQESTLRVDVLPKPKVSPADGLTFERRSLLHKIQVQDGCLRGLRSRNDRVDEEIRDLERRILPEFSDNPHECELALREIVSINQQLENEYVNIANLNRVIGEHDRLYPAAKLSSPGVVIDQQSMSSSEENSARSLYEINYAPLSFNSNQDSDTGLGTTISDDGTLTMQTLV